MKTLILVGPMGSGKTTLGKRLAKELGVQFTDTDKLVAKTHGSITKIFEVHGEQHFRDLEHIALTEAIKAEGVIATGGGVVLRPENLALMKGHSVVFLDTAAEFVLGKINLEKRPLLKDNPERWQTIYDERKKLYEEVATATLFTGGASVKALIKQLKDLVEQ
jgi:shikimate kinase